MKQKCKSCNKNKDLIEFHKDKSRKYGYRYVCKACMKIKNAEYWKQNAWRLTKRNQNYKHRSPEAYAAILKHQAEYKKRNRERALYLQARKRAGDLKLDFDIELTDIKIPQKCPLLGIKIENNGMRNRDFSPSLDRIVPSKGYVVGNVWIISFKANRIKNNSSFDEFELIYKNWKGRRRSPLQNRRLQ